MQNLYYSSLLIILVYVTMLNTFAYHAYWEERISQGFGQLDGLEFKVVQGFITKAADTKHLNSFDDLYYGLRLDYDGTKFFLDEGYCYVLRFKSKEVPLKVNVPRGRDFKDSYPFTSHGFTAGIRGRIGVPEFIIKSGFRVPIEGGTEIWKITRDGKQTLYAVFEEGKFIVLK